MRLGLEGRAGPWVASAVLLSATLPFAAAKPLTNDEIYTLRVSMQPSFAGIWSALASGADNLPPLDYWLRHVSISLLGPSPLSLRLPSILAVWLAMVLVYRLVARFLDPRYAFGAAMLLLIACGHEAALQTRGYALLLCWFAVSLSVWPEVATGHARATDRILFLAGLVGAIYSHYYGVLHAVAFALASVSSAARHLPIGRQPYTLIALAAVLGAPLQPLIATASRFSDRFWTPVTMTSALSFYPALLAPALPCVLVIAVLASVLPAAGETDREPAAARAGVPREVRHALVWFAAMPVAMFIVARLATGAFLPRYAVASAAALSILAVVLASRVRARPAALAGVVALVPLAFMIVPAARQVSALRTNRYRVAFTASLEAFQRTAQHPVIIGDDGVFVELSQSDTEQRLSNCYFLYDAVPAQSTNVDRAVRGLLEVWPIRAMPFDAMRQRADSFAFIGNWDHPVLTRAKVDGARIEPQTDAASGLAYWRVSF